jgi:hypothetical protein
VEAGNRRPKIIFRMEPDLHRRIHQAAELLYDGNESMFVRKACERLLDEMDEQRRRAAAVALQPLMGGEREAAVA